MADEDMPLEESPAEMFQLSADRRMVEVTLPPLSLPGIPKPVDIFFDWDLGVVEDILKRLIELRSRMVGA